MRKLPYQSMAAALIGTTLLAAALLTGCENKSTAANPDEALDSRTKLSLNLVFPNPLPDMPEGTTLSNNPWINLVKDYANVNLELADYSPGIYKNNVPDILDSYDPIETYAAARDGVFLDLKPYYDISPALQQVVTPQMMEFAKDTTNGTYWRIPIPSDVQLQGEGIIARYDLIQKYNGGKWPEKVEDWIALLRKIKQKEPNSIPMSNWVNGDELFSSGGVVFFNMLGANPTGFRIQGGKVIPNVLLPEYKAAVEIYRELYAEGLFDTEFATIRYVSQWDAKWLNNNVLFQWGQANQLFPLIASSQMGTHRLAFAPDLKTYPPVVSDPRYAQGFLRMPITTEGLYISSKSKAPDEAFKVIEALASKELATKLQEPGNRWSRIYNLFFRSAGNGQLTSYEKTIGTDYFKIAKDSMVQRQTDAEANGINGLVGYIAPDEAARKKGFSIQSINSFTTRAIMGRITMDQFDQERRNWEKDYRTILYAPMQAYFDQNKEYLLKLGVKMADW